MIFGFSYTQNWIKMQECLSAVDHNSIKLSQQQSGQIKVFDAQSIVGDIEMQTTLDNPLMVEYYIDIKIIQSADGLARNITTDALLGLYRRETENLTSLTRNESVGGNRVPDWVKVTLPMAETHLGDASMVDLALPVAFNPFHVAMMENPVVIDELKRHTEWREGSEKNHILLVGPSGCGKTSAVESLAVTKYVLFLKCPFMDINHEIATVTKHATDTRMGFRMNHAQWNSTTGSAEGACRLFFSEIASRLVVLHNLLLLHGSKFTPLNWLLFVISEEGHSLIGDVFLAMTDKHMDITALNVNDLLRRVTRLVGCVPVLFCDELQRFSKTRVVGSNGVDQSLMDVIVNATALKLACPAVWTGSHIGFTVKSNTYYGIAKLYDSSQLGLRVLGHFTELSPDRVFALFTAIVDTSFVSDNTLAHLCCMLQGPARLLASFLAYLLTPVSESMKSVRELSDKALRKDLEEYLEKMAMKSSEEEVSSSVPTDKNTVVYNWCLNAVKSQQRLSLGGNSE